VNVFQAPAPPPCATADAEFVGRQLLQRLGWQEGSALGRSGVAANTPIEVHKKTDNAGIGARDGYAAVAGAQSGGAGGIGSSAVIGVGAGSSSGLLIDEDLDSEKTKAWKRMMQRYCEPR
jgi:hypothetical protein